MASRPSKTIETFANPRPGREYEIRFDCPEFTCLCPLTGQPDFATFTITYIPDELCIELKSLKMYLWSFRDEGAFHEKVTNDVLDTIAVATGPSIVWRIFSSGCSHGIDEPAAWAGVAMDNATKPPSRTSSR